MAEPVLPSYSYPFAQYESQVVRSSLPMIDNKLTWTDISQGGYITSGKQGVVRIRSEETRRVSFFVNEREAGEWLQFNRSVGFRGNQFEFSVNQYLGMQLTFENTLQDIANNNSVYPTTVISYTLVRAKTAAVPTSGYPFKISWSNSLQAPTGGEGNTFVLTFVPLFSLDTSSVHVLLDIGFGIALTNRVLFAKAEARNTLQFNLWGSPISAFETAASLSVIFIQSLYWRPGEDIVTLFGQYTNTGSLSFWYRKNNGPIIAATETGALLAGSMAVTCTGTTGTIGNFQGYQWGYDRPAPMKILHFASYRYPFSNPSILSSYFLVGQNYYNKAELVDGTFDVVRANPGSDMYAVSMTIRQGI